MPHPTLSKGEGFKNGQTLKVLLLWRRMGEGFAV